MIATLPMYDWPLAMAAHDRLWGGIRDRLRANGHPAPESLSRDVGLWETWESADMVLSQTCGMPFRTRLHGQVNLVGTPDYALPDAPGGYYYSNLVARVDDSNDLCDYFDRTLAINGQDSQSGWAAPQNHAAAMGCRFVKTLHTGAHRESARAVAAGRASLASVDAVTWRHFLRHFPEEARLLKVIAHTDPTPGLPLITARARPPAPFTLAAGEAISDLAPADREVLGLRALVQIAASDYLSVPTPAPPTQDSPAV